VQREGEARSHVERALCGANRGAHRVSSSSQPRRCALSEGLSSLRCALPQQPDALRRDAARACIQRPAAARRTSSASAARGYETARLRKTVTVATTTAARTARPPARRARGHASKPSTDGRSALKAAPQSSSSSTALRCCCTGVSPPEERIVAVASRCILRVKRAERGRCG
jgi:hypothetical protein